ncbi:hypothetical protein FHR81_001659 [Actinoalloteichus hoggarensis]|uniref:hypothetical protein n=1 Tax=Actinoalloteichus hoggarensis TaxID=1470176 RepID=UPI0017C67F38|nr:hypothetical protein [Actinoalloteichus hoggarensis]MBB5920629.1 hypothetical protein [Actinoalloteichus hoggarensis]
MVGLLSTMGGVSLAVPKGDPSIRSPECSGWVTYSERLANGLGELVIYYKSSDGGTNSACFYHLGKMYGVAAPTAVRIERCLETVGAGAPGCTRDFPADVDSGNFSYYAGPVGVPGTADRCVRAVGEIVVDGRRHHIDSYRRGC